MSSNRHLNNKKNAEALLRLFNIDSSWDAFEELNPQFEPTRSIYQFANEVDKGRQGDLFETEPTLQLLNDAREIGFRFAFADMPKPDKNVRGPSKRLMILHKDGRYFSAPVDMSKSEFWSKLYQLVYKIDFKDEPPRMEFVDHEHEALLTFIDPTKKSTHSDYEKYGKRLPAIQKDAHPDIPQDNFIFPFSSHDASDHSDPILTSLDGHTSDSAFASMAHKSFGQHYPLEIRPDDLHLMIVQGINRFVEHYPEDFRNVMVNFDGKKHLEVTLSDINDINGWKNLPAAFASLIKQSILVPVFADLLLQEYSQSTDADRVSKAITMMGTFSSYFHYIASTLCHIPQFILKGSIEDWKKLADMPNRIISELKLPEMKPGDAANGRNLLHRWLSRLQPVLQKMSLSRQGEVDAQFWKNFYKQNSSSGTNANAISGNILFFFPFLKKDNSVNTSFILNEYIMGEKVTIGGPRTHQSFGLYVNGPPSSQLTANYVNVDFQLNHQDKTYPMGMKAGIIAHKTDKVDKRVSAYVGYSMFFKNDKPEMKLHRDSVVEHAEQSNQPVIPVQESDKPSLKETSANPPSREISVKLVY